MIAGLIGAVAGGGMILATVRLHAAERRATDLCVGAGLPRMRLAQTLPRLADLLASVDHRTSRRHPVTGLPTREILLSAIAAEGGSTARGHLLGLIRLVDFDRLAAFDHAAANQALLSFSDRLVLAVDAAHLLVQVDRDAFAIWFRADASAAGAEFGAIIYVIAQDLEIGSLTLSPVVEAGSARHDDGGEPVHLLMRAIAALSRSDTAVGEALPPATPSPREARERFRLEQDLAQAIARDELTMVFQPIVDLAAGKVVGAEALIRWQHPELGAISPAVFIPIVEEAGLSERYGMWTLNAACREARCWADEGLSDLRVAVNLSARQLLDDQLVLKIERTLSRHGLPASALELELTETAAMVQTARTVDLFRRLSMLGVRLAIDDFGSGYSSLSYLKNLPFNKLKIDREFVTAVQDRRDSQAICKALIELGRGLGLVVLAEGVEDEAEVATLHALGCTIFQGYHFSRPLEGADFRRFVRTPAWRAPRAGPAPGRTAHLEGRLSA
ncbi:putative bifunctional diguanylate cyclase/phosphodiesterase [Sphingomonas solaris]|uniref:putative bifunctional diguanylate cyclase/phosphodiesterase n=1 Tax=Alterirhizorhabdus solaris TaxID=2529389 RepID=UPI001396A312|nr:bifunctional diguanylate cyclase/phosphodiesterase [Sphingomonas solaris]